MVALDNDTSIIDNRDASTIDNHRLPLTARRWPGPLTLGRRPLAADCWPPRSEFDSVRLDRMMSKKVLLGAVLLASAAVRLPGDPFRPAGPAGVLLFVTSDCPIANAYAPEIQRLCSAFAPKGVACTLVYEDVHIDEAAVRKHRDEYRYGPAISSLVDADRAIATRAKAAVTPEAVVVDRAGTVRYRGRIDNKYVAIGKPRRVVTVHDLEDALDAVVAGKPVTAQETTAFGCDIVRLESPR
jgi:hypothetical protein